MTMRLSAFLTALFTTLSIQAGAAQETHLRWLEESDRLASTLPGSGAYAAYEKVQLSLVQAYTYAALGDVNKTLTHLPFSSSDTDWLSGGDGMVRQLLIGDALRDVHRLLFKELADSGRSDDVIGYIDRLNLQQRTPDLFFELGYFFPSINLPETKEHTAAMFGGVFANIENGNLPQARSTLASIPDARISPALDQQAQLLMMNGNWQAASALYRISADAGLIGKTRIKEAISVAVQARQMDTAEALARLLGDQLQESHEVQIALGYAHDEQFNMARQVFQRVDEKKDRSWETVAIMLKEDAWLRTYYSQLADHWRRSERFYQLAKRQLSDGMRDAALNNINSAEQAAQQIKTPSTRALAFKMLAEFYGLYGNPNRVEQMVRAIPEDPSLENYRGQARQFISLAWTVDGDVDKAIVAGLEIGHLPNRVTAMTKAAVLAFNTSESDYTRLITAIETDIQHSRDEGLWREVVAARLRVGDVKGAESTVSRAKQLADMPALDRALVEHYLTEGAFESAIAAANRLPEDNQFRRQKAYGDIVKIAAANNAVETALDILPKINQPHIRDLSTTPVIRALVDSGKSETAEQLAAQINRRDAREDALAVLLYKQAAQGKLPSVELMQTVPRNSNGLCWAVSASAEVDTKALEHWLNNLDDDGCRAFAYVGAAQNLVARQDAAAAFRLIDPMQTTERMTEAMQRQAVFQRFH